ncbi:hypothetical protein H0N99_02835 [Candidatus Micrarchaeota archaeon]|nr:hypothetical protein [Candidatus Micrarchaeota archaeon]
MNKKSELPMQKRGKTNLSKTLLQILTTILIVGFLFGASLDAHTFCQNPPELYYFSVFLIFLTLIVVSSQRPIVSLPFVIILAAFLGSTVYIKGC